MQFCNFWIFHFFHHYPSESLLPYIPFNPIYYIYNVQLVNEEINSRFYTYWSRWHRAAIFRARNTLLTRPFSSTLHQATQSKDDGSLVLLNDLQGVKKIILIRVKKIIKREKIECKHCINIGKSKCKIVKLECKDWKNIGETNFK